MHCPRPSLGTGGVSIASEITTMPAHAVRYRAGGNLAAFGRPATERPVDAVVIDREEMFGISVNRRNFTLVTHAQGCQNMFEGAVQRPF